MSIESRSNQYGSVFGNWQIKNILGQGSGGKSAVFKLCRNNSDWEETCALKVINLMEERGSMEDISDYRKDEYISARESCSKNAVQEVRLMATLRGNTNIVDYLDYTFSDWQSDSGFGRDMLIRMELLNDLRSELKKGRVYREEEIIKIGRDICAALALCHGKDIWHRDIKPENIFINEDGNYKLGDFGISKIMSATPTAMASTGVCTPEYAAPEQLSGKHDKRVDIYSLGLVLYELSNKNRLPFAESSYVRQEEVQKRHIGTALPAPSNASAALAQVILKACAFKPKDRYQIIQEFAKALEDLQAKEQIKTRRITSIALNCGAFTREGYDDNIAQNIGHYIYLSGSQLIYKNIMTPALEGKKLPDGFFDEKKRRISKWQLNKILAEIDALDLHELQEDACDPTGESVEIVYNTGEVYKYAKTGAKGSPFLKVSEMLAGLCRFSRLPSGWEKVQKDAKKTAEETEKLEVYQTVPTVDPYATMPAKPHNTSETSVRRIKKSWVIISVTALILVVALLIHSCSGFMLADTEGSTVAQQIDWSDWQDDLPDYVTDEDYDIEEQVLYRSRTQETTSSTTQDTMEGWELYNTAKGGEYGSWSMWSTEKVTASETREVETQQQYRYRTKEKAKASTSSKKGWELYDTQYTSGEYGNWSDWSETVVKGSNSRQVETKTQYSYRSVSYSTEYTQWGAWSGWQDSVVETTEYMDVETRTVYPYYYFYCLSCKNRGIDARWAYCGGYCGQCGAYIDVSYAVIEWFSSPWSASAYWPYSRADLGDKYYQIFEGTMWWNWTNGSPKTQYRYRTRSVTQTTSFGTWSYWSDTAVSSDANREVVTRTVYRYRDCEQIPTYHFWRWSAWSGWSENFVSETSDCDVESATHYRYRDKVTEITYYFCKWSDWSDYSDVEVISSETTEVETKTQYRFKLKVE